MNLDSNVAIETNAHPYAARHEWNDEDVVARHDPLALSLDDLGMIQDCSNSFEILFGCGRSDLVGQHVSTLLPQLKGVELVQSGQVNPLLNYLCRCGELYQVQNPQGGTFSSNLSVVRIEYAGKRSLRLIVRPYRMA